MAELITPEHLARSSARWERVRSAWFLRQPWGALRAQEHRRAAEAFEQQAQQFAAQ